MKLYTFFTVHISIVEQNAPKEGIKRPLRLAIKTTMDQFQIEFPEEKPPSLSILDRFWGRFYFPTSDWRQWVHTTCSDWAGPREAMVL